MQKLIAILFLVFLAESVVADTALPFIGKIISPKATLRLCADKSCQIVDRAKEGEELTFIAHEGDRYQTEQGRWIHGDFVEPISNLKYDDLVAKINAPAELRTKTGNTLPFLGVINSSKATIRNCAKQSCKIVDRPKKGNHYLFVSQSGDRLQTTNGEWIHEDFIEFKESLNFKETNAIKEETNMIIIVDENEKILEMRKNGETIKNQNHNDTTHTIANATINTAESVKSNSNLKIQTDKAEVKDYQTINKGIQPNKTNETVRFLDKSDENASKVLAKKGIILDPTVQKLIDGESANKEKENEKLQQDSINFAQKAVGVAKSLEGSDDKKAAIVNLAGGYAKTFVKEGVKEFIEDFYTGVNFDLGFDYDFNNKNWSGNGKILIPYTTDNYKTTIFSQSGIGLYPNDRWIAHTGVGVRYYPFATGLAETGDFMLGLNTVYDHDLSRKHKRYSLGAEFMYKTFLATTNVYQRLSGWKDSYDFDKDWVEERPANGWDINLKYAHPDYKQLALTGGFETWRGEKVSVFGTKNKEDLEENPKVYKIGLEYQPIPLITLSLDHARTSKSEKQTTVKLSFNIPLGDKSAWRKATNPRYAGVSNTIEASRNSFITRNYSMPLEYRAKPGKYHIEYCGQPGDNKYCFLITDGFDEIAKGVHVKITPKHSCVILDNGGNYVTNGQGKVTATVTSSCTPSTTLHVVAGNSEGDFNIKIQKIDMKISASPTEIERHETSLITLQGNSATSGMAVSWSIDGKGSLSNKSETIDANGKATVTYTPDASSVDGETVKVIADVEGNKFEVTITIRIYGLGSSLVVTPTQIGNTEWSTAELSGLRPGTDVTFTLTTNNESATLHATQE